MDYKDILKILDTSLPPVFRRRDIDKLTGGVITEALLKALPVNAPRLPYARFGKYVVYEKAKFLKWAEEYYGQFIECSVAGFAGTKIRRLTGAEREAGSGCEGNQGS